MKFELKKEIRLKKVRNFGNGLTRIIANNASPMTFHGTCTYLLGHKEITVIDPGPDNLEHFNLILETLNGRQVSKIILTHSHLDHSGLAKRLSKFTKAPVFLFGSRNNRRSSAMQKIYKGRIHSEYESLFSDIELKFIQDGERIKESNFTLEVIYTPGHHYDHICLSWIEQKVLFSGDHVMGWSSTMIAPPDGDMKDFMDSMQKLSLRPENIYFPGHGPLIVNSKRLLSEQISHRLSRENQILDELKISDYNAYELASKIYVKLDNSLYQAAVNNIFAHLIDLYMRKIVSCKNHLSINSIFKIKNFR